MKRDSRGKFCKAEERKGEIIVDLPSIANIIFYGVLIFIMLPWLVIISKFNVWQNIRNKIEELFAFPAQNNEETPKKWNILLSYNYLKNKFKLKFYLIFNFILFSKLI